VFLLKYLYKLIGLTLVITFLINLGLPILYLGTYQFINRADPTIYPRYATNNKYDNNIFFNEDINYRSGIISDMIEIIPDVNSINRIQDFAKIISNNKEKMKLIIDKNKLYKEYLSKQGSSVSELFEWSQKTAALDDNIIQMCLFLIFLVFAVISVMIFKCRKTFYTVAGFVYLITIMSAFSNGLSDYIIVYIANMLFKIFGNTITYLDMNSMKTLIMQAYKESLLAFIIFDTIIQIVEGNKDKRRETEIKTCIYSLDYIINFLRKFENREERYKARFKIPQNELLKVCNKNKKNKYCQELESDLKDFKFWGEVHTTKEYVNKLWEIRMQIYNIPSGIFR
jgi:hypothetical protein